MIKVSLGFQWGFGSTTFRCKGVIKKRNTETKPLVFWRPTLTPKTCLIHAPSSTSPGFSWLNREKCKNAWPGWKHHSFLLCSQVFEVGDFVLSKTTLVTTLPPLDENLRHETTRPSLVPLSSSAVERFPIKLSVILYFFWCLRHSN